MKICLTNKHGTWTTANTGKGKFATRLIAAWQRLGATVTTDPNEKCDVDMQITMKRYDAKNARVRVVRVGPVTYDTNVNYRKMNGEIKKYMRECDGIIYQSAFSKKAVDALVAKPKRTPCTIIHNGSDVPVEIKAIGMMPQHKINFLASTREWVLEKRLPDICEAFVASRIPDSCLWIAGTVYESEPRYSTANASLMKKYRDYPIRFAGQQSDVTLPALYKMANAMIHAVYIDACPNAVAEALCLGCPVIMNGCGGQFELPTYIGYQKEQPWDFQPRDRRKPPKADVEWMANAMREIVSNPPHVDASKVDINDIAGQYLEFFEDLLCR
jgi:glycosyltransferase involved in cell wall biosynthesis